MSGPRAAVGLEGEADAEWVRELTFAPPERVRAALGEAAEEHALEEALLRAHREKGRDFYAHFRAPYELYALVRLLEPLHVVEAGVSSGVSSAYFLTALRRNGKGTLHSIDRPTFQRGEAFRPGEDSPVALPPGTGSGWAVPPDLRSGWDLRVGPTQDHLPRLLTQLPSVGLFLHDDHHTFAHATFEFTHVLPKLAHGGVLLADNTAWLGGALDTFAQGQGGRALAHRAFDLAGWRRP